MEDGFFGLHDRTAYASRSTCCFIEVDFLLLFVTYIRPGFRYRLGPLDVPHHRM